MFARLRKPIPPRTYQRITVLALVFLTLIVVTGAGVRLTGSGLGCTDWPTCTETRFVADRGDVHAMVEFVNRLITGLVSAAVALAVLGSHRRSPRRRDLVWLSWGLVAGVVAQVVLGALVTLTHLNPWVVQGHFVLSMLLLLDGMVLAHRAGLPDDAVVRPAVTPALLRWGWGLVGLATVVILTGTLVTGSGPHSGHNEAEAGASRAARIEAARDVRRLPIAVHDAARIHGIAMVVFLGATIWVLVQLRRHGAPERLQSAATALLTVLVLQAAIGYTQYFTGVPALLVALHVLGASLVWLAVLGVALRMQLPLEGPTAHAADSSGDLGADHVPHGDLVPGR
ncbi:MAG: COX15/CtaA family protein [Acidimicrobiales bacterium]